MDDLKKIIVVSDGTGKTAKRLMDAVLAQYSDQEVRFSLEKIYQEVRTTKKVDSILNKIDSDSLVIFSIISDNLRKYFHKNLHNKEILHLDVLNPMLRTMRKFLGVDPNYRPGLLQIIDDKYYSKIDAIGYTVEHDDGRGYQHHLAQVVLLGLSRTCKTPISMYLACNYGLRIANIPIIADECMKKQLLNKLKKVKHKNLIGLIMSAEVLSQVRVERSNVLVDDSLGKSSIENYSDIRAIRDEIRFCRWLFNELDIEVIDVTRRAIEEVSGEILDLLGIDDRESHL